VCDMMPCWALVSLVRYVRRVDWWFVGGFGISCATRLIEMSDMMTCMVGLWYPLSDMCDGMTCMYSLLWQGCSIIYAKDTYKREDILQKRPIILSILLTVATPYVGDETHSFWVLCHIIGVLNWFEVDISARPASSFRAICVLSICVIFYTCGILRETRRIHMCDRITCIAGL